MHVCITFKCFLWTSSTLLSSSSPSSSVSPFGAQFPCGDLSNRYLLIHGRGRGEKREEVLIRYIQAETRGQRRRVVVKHFQLWMLDIPCFVLALFIFGTLIRARKLYYALVAVCARTKEEGIKKREGEEKGTKNWKGINDVLTLPRYVSSQTKSHEKVLSHPPPPPSFLLCLLSPLFSSSPSSLYSH